MTALQTAHPIYGLREPTPREFAGFQKLVEEASGIHLSSAKRSLLVGRLASRVHHLNLRSFGEYLERASSDPGELVEMLDRISTNETHFFREDTQLRDVERLVFPAWRSRGDNPSARKVRIWSAGCSTGEEPYTLAMMLLSHFDPAAGWSLDVRGTDLSARVLARARQGTWPIDKAREIPATYLKRFMQKGVRSQEGRMRAGPEIRAIVRFDRLNLNLPEYPIEGSFDLILCRNVLIYFDAERKRRTIERLADRLVPGGHLVVGSAESLVGQHSRLRALAPSVYTVLSPVPPAS